MPDPERRTISATQSSALFGASPYYTRWMLYQHFANGMPLDSEGDSRMIWGKKLQPLVLEHAAQELRLEVRPNADDTYHRRSRLGCTRDATIICPDKGPGALETKCCFDYRTWMTDWLGGKHVPRQHEIQLQQQMLVGDGESSLAYEWGIIAAWVCGDVHYFERKPIPLLWRRLAEEAYIFFEDVAQKREPHPFGAPIEIPWLTELFPVEAGKTVDPTHDSAAGEAAVQYRNAKDQESAGSNTAEPLRAKLLAMAMDAEELLMPDGVVVRIRKHGKGKRLTVYVPDL